MEVQPPRIEAPSDAIVRVSATAICGSDLHPYRGTERGLDRGTVLGHEFVGEVLEIGSAVQSLAVGTRVTSPFTTSCGTCSNCRNGLSCRCIGGELFGWVEQGRGLRGAQAELVRVPLAATTLVAVPDEIEDRLALLAGDVLATGSYAVELAGVVPGDVIVVVGLGPVGLCAVWAARRAGAARVFAIDRDEVRLGLAAAFGARAIQVDKDDAGTILRAYTDSRGADAVIEAVGTPQATRRAFELVRAGGTIAAVGVHTERDLAFSPGEAYDKNLTYRAGRCPARRFVEPLLAVLRTEGSELAALFSHRLSLSDCADAYRIFDERRDRCTKVVLSP